METIVLTKRRNKARALHRLKT